MTQLHLLFLAYSAVCILVSDHLGMQYFLGRKPLLPARTMTLLHRLVWIGLLGMIATGVALALPDWDYYATDPAFLLKMGLVGVLCLNGLFIGRLMHTATMVPFRELPRGKKLLLLTSGGASGAGWICATLIGFFWL